MELTLDAYGQEVVNSYLMLAVRTELLDVKQLTSYNLNRITARQAAELAPIIGPLFHADTVKEVKITNLFMMFARCGE